MRIILLLVLLITYTSSRPLDDENQAQEGDDKRDKISNPDPTAATDKPSDKPTEAAVEVKPTEGAVADPSSAPAIDKPSEAAAAVDKPSESSAEKPAESAGDGSDESAVKKDATVTGPTTIGPPATAPTAVTTVNPVKPSSTKAPAISSTPVPKTSPAATTAPKTTTTAAATASPKPTTEGPKETKTVEKSDNNTLTMRGTTFHVAIRFLDEKFTDDLNFPQNPVYQSLKQHVMTTVADVYKNYKEYKQAVVIKFSDSKGGKDTEDNDKRDDIDNPGVVVDFYLRFYTSGTHLEKLTEAVKAGKLGTHPVSTLFIRAYTAEPKGRVCTPDCKIQCYSYCDAGCCHLHVFQHVELPEESPVDSLLGQQQPCQGVACSQPTQQVPCQGASCAPAMPVMTQLPCQGTACAPPVPQTPCQGASCSPPVPQAPCQGTSCAPPIQQSPCQGASCAAAMPAVQSPCQGMSCLQQQMPIPQIASAPCQGSSCMPGMQQQPCKGASCSPPMIPQISYMPYPAMPPPMPPPMLLPQPCPPSCSQVCAPSCPNQCCGMQPPPPPATMFAAPIMGCGPRGC